MHRWIEPMLLALILLSLFLLNKFFEPASGMLTLFAASFAFYYLASGILVLIDKNNIERSMRIIWFMGMWTVSFAIIGCMMRLLFWNGSKIFLLISGASALAVIAYSYLTRMGLQGELKSAYQREMKPMIIRLIAGLIFAGICFFSSNRSLYYAFGAYRDDPTYVDLIERKLNEPGNPQAQEAWQSYHEQKKAEERSQREKELKKEIEERKRRGSD
jgi:hypothetical protein